MLFINQNTQKKSIMLMFLSKIFQIIHITQYFLKKSKLPDIFFEN